MSKFEKGKSGNPAGRPKGVQDRRTMFRELVEPYKEDLTETAIDLALSGNEQMLRLLLDRLLPAKPKDEPIGYTFELGQSLAERSEQIQSLMSTGKLTPTEANSLMSILSQHAKVIETAELSDRLMAIEKALKERKKL